jgi:hypothetical protein
VGGLRGRSRAAAGRPASTGPSRSVSAAARRRTFIPKADGEQRSLAIAALEDKIVQGPTVLNAIYEEEFLGFSYRFWPGR